VRVQRRRLSREHQHVLGADFLPARVASEHLGVGSEGLGLPAQYRGCRERWKDRQSSGAEVRK